MINRYFSKKKLRIRKPAQKKPNYAFIDAQNLNLGTQRYGWKLDWKRFLMYLKEKHQVQKAFLFIGYLPENEDLYQQMSDIGYTVVLKPTVAMLISQDKESAKNEDHQTKGNADAELVLYAMKELQNYHKAVIVSGDGDFYCIVEYLINQNKFEVLLTPNGQYSSLFKVFESKIVNLDKHRQEFVYDYVRGSKNNKNNSKKPRNYKKSQPKSKTSKAGYRGSKPRQAKPHQWRSSRNKK